MILALTQAHGSGDQRPEVMSWRDKLSLSKILLGIPFAKGPKGAPHLTPGKFLSSHVIMRRYCDIFEHDLYLDCVDRAKIYEEDNYTTDDDPIRCTDVWDPSGMYVLITKDPEVGTDCYGELDAYIHQEIYEGVTQNPDNDPCAAMALMFSLWELDTVERSKDEDPVPEGCLYQDI